MVGRLQCCYVVVVWADKKMRSEAAWRKEHV